LDFICRHFSLSSGHIIPGVPGLEDDQGLGGLPGGGQKGPSLHHGHELRRHIHQHLGHSGIRRNRRPLRHGPVMADLLQHLRGHIHSLRRLWQEGSQDGAQPQSHDLSRAFGAQVRQPIHPVGQRPGDISGNAPLCLCGPDRGGEVYGDHPFHRL